jgi:hypothetical protein
MENPGLPIPALVRWRTDGRGTSWHDGRAVIECPKCGADRLIPLTFPVYQREQGREVVFRRPMAKCSGCGERVYARVVATQALPIQTEWQ